MKALAGDPRAAVRPLADRPGRGRGPPFALHVPQPGLDITEQPVDGATAGCAQEINRRDLGGTSLQPCELGIARSSFLGADPRTRSDSLEEPPRRLGDLRVVDVAGGVEYRLDLLVGKPFHESCLADRGIATALHDLSRDPLKVLLGLLAPGQDVDRVLDCDGAKPLEPAPDLDAEIVRLRWDLVDEKEPACFSGLGHGVSLKHLNPIMGTDVSTTFTPLLPPRPLDAAFLQRSD